MERKLGRRVEDSFCLAMVALALLYMAGHIVAWLLH